MEITFKQALDRLNELANEVLPESAWTEDRFVILLNNKRLTETSNLVSNDTYKPEELVTIFVDPTVEGVSNPFVTFDNAAVFTAFEAQTEIRDLDGVQILHYADALKVARTFQSLLVAKLAPYAD